MNRRVGLKSQSLRADDLNPLDLVSIPVSLKTAPVWGRTGAGRSWLRSLIAASPILFAPLASVSIFVTLAVFEGSFAEFFSAVRRDGFLQICLNHGPQLTWEATAAVALWLGVQALFFRILPGEMHSGQYTPAGHLLTYKVNGLFAWIVTHVGYGMLCWLGILNPAFIPLHWNHLIAAMNLAGLAISTFAFLKAHINPTHPNDRKFSGASDLRAVCGLLDAPFHTDPSTL